MMARSRPKRSAAVMCSKKLKGTNPDPAYSPDDVLLAHLDFDRAGGKYRCKATAVGDGFYDVAFIDSEDEADGYETERVHWDSAHGQGHGLWRPLKRVEEEEEEDDDDDTTRKQKKRKTSPLPSTTKKPVAKKKPAKETPKKKTKVAVPKTVKKKLGNKREVIKALRAFGLPITGSHEELQERLENHGKLPVISVLS